MNDYLALYLEDEHEGELGHDENPVLGVDLVIRTRPSNSLQPENVLQVRIISWTSKESSLSCHTVKKG